ncbi:unnamed protein product [Darwinula stevensoni]|uniref:Ribosomal protein S30 n=1 Tax=Darwinula stevensoni TaxID=69355 RepID=A0A7R8XD06_9CRUS|nr:unnamed protein product [Darwinula stevensoni]CAG0892767.1 unnamed protein product [Darwinula stevensoni]
MGAMAKFKNKHHRDIWSYLQEKVKTELPSVGDMGVITTKSEGRPEYVEIPEYPELFDASPKGMKRYNRDQWFAEIRASPTIEEKYWEIAKQKYYGHYTFQLKPDFEPYGALEYMQGITRTHLIIEERLPEVYDGLDAEAANLVERISDRFQDALIFQLTNHKENKSHNAVETSRAKAQVVLQSLVEVLIAELCSEFPHLQSASVDILPRVGATWVAGGLGPHRSLRRLREKVWKKSEEEINEPYEGNASAQVRTELPLPEVVPRDDPLVLEGPVPQPLFHPRALKLKGELLHPINTPGIWPSDPCPFGLVAFLPQDFLVREHICSFGDHYDDQEALHQRGIIAGFAWTFSQAIFQGFDPYNDITYPLVSHVVLSDGRNFSFYVYQLNTIKFHDEYAMKNPQRNLCWATTQQPLFDAVEGGQLHGFNKTVLFNLLKLLIRSPKERVGVNLQPYLGAEKVAANLSDDRYRNCIEEQYKHLSSNRPRHFDRPEIYPWEKIYKVDHNTRPVEPKIRWLRKLPSQHFVCYVTYDVM